MGNGTITTELVERVLEKLGFKEYPGNDLAGLDSLYGRWCRRVPFDNLQKRLHLAAGDPVPMPGNNSTLFFQDWLTYGTGGTCWGVSHALHDLLQTLGFNVDRAAGTMLTSPTVRGPNHGTVIVTIEGCRYLVDGSMLTEQPLPLRDSPPFEAKHPGTLVQLARRTDQWQIFWRPLHRHEGIWCRMDAVGVSVSAFDRYYEGTREWGPFNYFLYARINNRDQVTGVVANRKIAIGTNGQATSEAINSSERAKFLVEQMGMAEEIITRQPADEPLPPPPSGLS